MEKRVMMTLQTAWQQDVIDSGNTLDNQGILNWMKASVPDLPPLPKVVYGKKNRKVGAASASPDRVSVLVTLPETWQARIISDGYELNATGVQQWLNAHCPHLPAPQTRGGRRAKPAAASRA